MWGTQGFILGPLYFLIFVNDLKKSTKLFNPIMSTDDNNLFHTNKIIKVLFGTANKELHFVNEWFIVVYLLTQKKLNINFFVNKAHLIVFY